MPKVLLKIDTGYPTASHTEAVEIDDVEWSELDEEGREALLDEMAQEYLNNHCYVSARIVE